MLVKDSLEKDLLREFRKLPASEQDEVVKTLKQIVGELPVMKAAVAQAKAEIPFQYFAYSADPISLDIPNECPSTEKEKDKTMCFDCDYDLTPAQRHLANRASDIYHKKNNALEHAFGLRDDESPRTINDLVARITSGKFTFNASEADQKKYTVREVVSSITWRDPAVKQDQVGYDAALVSLETSRTAVEDQIFVSDAATALKALQDFEAAPLPTATPPAA